MTWAGRDDFACDKAIAMARKGYLGFAIDIYGDAKVGKYKQENVTLMNNLLGEKYALMTRLRTTYNTVKRIPKVDNES